VAEPHGAHAPWPSAVVCRAVPAVLLIVGVAVPAIRWSALPRHRPGALIWALIVGVAGLLILLPQIWKPRGWAPEQWERPAYWMGALGVLLGWLRSRFGPVAAGLFLLALGAGLAVGITIASAHSGHWHISPAAAVGSILGALAVSVCGGLVARQFGRFVDREGRYVRPQGVGGGKAG